MRVVLDTNLYVSYLLSHRPPIATLIDVQLKSEDFSLLTAFPTLVELERVLRYPKFQDYITEVEGKRFLALVRAVSEMVDLPDSLPRICRDPDDDWLVACGVVGGADLIVSGDRDLLTLGKIGKITILSPAQFLDTLK